MRVQVFDVSHGFCAYLIADNGNKILIDCGHNKSTGFSPSEYLSRSRCTTLEQLIIQNFDQDHVSDLPNLRRMLPIQILSCNRSISTDTLIRIKQESGPITDAMQSAINMMRDYWQGVTLLSTPYYPSLRYTFFHNSYPEFIDTNNLSLVTFIDYDGLNIIFPGDLQKEGWLKLLENPIFCDHLRKVNIFIASHHGRQDGYCREVFNYCYPEIVIISDSEIIHETQKNLYASHASGVPWEGGADKRYVFTTRTDGMITITKQIGVKGNISTSN